MRRRRGASARPLVVHRGLTGGDAPISVGFVSVPVGAGGGATPLGGGEATSASTSPAVSLPKAGGSVRGLGEAFAANPATGTGSLRVPLPRAATRGDFAPSLALTYDTGAGQGPFGLGWSVDLPVITRKTDRGLPMYADNIDSDVFLLFGVEDLVAVAGPDGRPLRQPLERDARYYEITRYRPRTEGQYARIERWTDADTGETHWRTITRDNHTSLYGTTDDTRICDPADQTGRRVFSWLIAESFDALGHAVVYTYARENGNDVDLASTAERTRSRTANRYVKSVRYGNGTSRLAPTDGAPQTWLFELVFDYGDHDPDAPTAVPTPARPWLARHDPFSRYRSGFELRTHRLCQRILLFHHFPDEPEVDADCLVQSLTLEYRSSRGVERDAQRGEPAGAVLASMTVAGHRRAAGGGYDTHRMPPLELSYSVPRIGEELSSLDPDNLEHLPVGVDGQTYQWVDLDGDGVPGVLSDHAGGWFFKPNLGGRLGPLRRLQRRPSASLAQSWLLDLGGDGALDVVAFDGPSPGYFSRADGDWSPHRAFSSLPVRDWRDPNLRFGDLSGDGRADALLTEGDVLAWHPGLGEGGFGPELRVPLATDEEHGPRLMFADGTQSVYLADFSGDGLPDFVRIRNGEVCWWPNLGYGRFGGKVVMERSPRFDHPDGFDHRRLRLADVDGTGPTDMIYLGVDGVDLHRNETGNGWAPPLRVAAAPPIDDLTTVSVVDLLGRGTACLVWSTPLPRAAGRQVRYVDLMGVKPNLLVHVRNNLGGETAVTYASSTKFALADRAAGRPWATPLPFPVQVVEKVETFDRVTRSRFVTTYRYRHGRFDGAAREFCGFGMVEQRDSDDLDVPADSAFPAPDNAGPAGRVAPLVTRTWFHTGFFAGRERISTLFADEYHADAWRLDDTPLPDRLTAADEREACRALKGRVLRQEVYSEDSGDRAPNPFTVLERNYTVERLQSATGARHGVFAVHPRDTVTASYEREPGDPRVTHDMVLAVDPYGTVTRAVAIAYGRAAVGANVPVRTAAVQARTLVTETRTELTDAIEEEDDYRSPVPHDVRTFHLTGAGVDDARPLPSRDWLEALAVPPARRLVERRRTRFEHDELSGPLPWGTQGARGLTERTYRLAFTPELLSATLGARVGPALLAAAGYVQIDGDWWAPSGTVEYAPGATSPGDVLLYAREHFFTPQRSIDPFGAPTETEYDQYDLLVVEVVDALGNRTTAGDRGASGARTIALDYRVLAPALVTDANLNRTAVSFDVLARVDATAVMGKADQPTGDAVPADDINAAGVAAFWADPYGRAPPVLGDATTRTLYDVDAFSRTRDDLDPQPPAVATIAREHHAGHGATGLRISFAYHSGAGQEVQHKLPARSPPGVAGPRWVTTGWVVRNNKGLAAREYEPVETATHRFERGPRTAVSRFHCYDPLDRRVATLHPDQTYDKLAIGAWTQERWDANDTAAVVHRTGATPGDPAEDPDIGRLIRGLPAGELQETWFAARIAGALGAAEQGAAQRTEVHAGTPSISHVDPLGRPVLAVGQNRTPGSPAVETAHRLHTVLDVTGAVLAALDCADGTPGLTTDSADRLLERTTYDLAGARVLEERLDADPRRQLTAVDGHPVAVWEALDGGAERRLGTTYDPLRRPLETVLHQPGCDVVVGRSEYGEAAAGATAANLCGRLWRTDDGAGRVTLAYDIQGNLARSERQLAAAYRETVDWSAAPTLEPNALATQSQFDALDRLELQSLPDGTVVRRAYDEGGRLSEIRARLPGDLADMVVVSDIRYDVHGRRTLLDHGNGVRTTFEYDTRSFRLRRQVTRRPPRFAQDEPVAPDQRRGVQDLRFVYDPVGNVIHVADLAQPRVFTLNTQVDASTEYTYDALYRLVEVRGREHLGEPRPTSWDDGPRAGTPDPGRLGRYVERHGYDVAGNVTSLDHTSLGPGAGGWSRTFVYEEPSRLEPGRADVRANRLTATRMGSGAREDYAYDARGNMTILPPLTLVRWNHRDQLTASARQRVIGAPPETTYHVRDGGGQRVRKVTDTGAAPGSAPRPFAECVYLGDYDLYRELDPAGAVTLARATVRITEGGRLVALIQRRVVGGASERLVRYQYLNQLGSATVELDGDAELISYEELYAYGATALLLWRAGAPPKRYRASAKERDAETGLYEHGARAYAPWLCRWTACDPLGSRDGPNVYAYVRGNPVRLSDPTGSATDDPVDPRQLHLTEQSELQQLVKATAKGRGITQYHRNQFQELANQYRRGAVDVGHVEPFWSLKAGQVSKTYAQLRTENQLNGATLDKAAAAEARAKGQFARVKGADPTATPGTRGPQPAEAPKLEGLGKSKPGVIGPTPAAATPLEVPKPSGPMPEQQLLDFDKVLPVKEAPKPSPSPPVEAPKASSSAGQSSLVQSAGTAGEDAAERAVGKVSVGGILRGAASFGIQVAVGILADVGAREILFHGTSFTEEEREKIAAPISIAGNRFAAPLAIAGIAVPPAATLLIAADARIMYELGMPILEQGARELQPDLSRMTVW